MIKKYNLIIFDLLSLFCFLVISLNRNILSEHLPVETHHPFLGRFMLFMLIAGIPLLGLIGRCYYIDVHWKWPRIIIDELLLSFPCALLVSLWAKLPDSYYTFIRILSPLYMLPGILLGLLLYYVIVAIIEDKYRVKRWSLVLFYVFNYIFVSLFIIYYAFEL